MIRQPGLKRRVDQVLPDRVGLPQTPAKQRVRARKSKEINGLRRRFNTILRVAPGIGRQTADIGDRLAEEPLVIDLRAVGHRLGGNRLRRWRDARVLLQRGDDRRAPADAVQRVGNIILQHGSGRDLDKDAAAEFRQRVNSLAEPHRLTRVAPPVFGVERNARRLPPRCGGDIDRMTLTRLQIREILDQFGADRVDGGRMVGIVDIQQLRRHPPLAGEFGEGLQRIDRPGDGG